MYPVGDTVDEALYQEIASVVNNISATYNMGLSVSLTPIPTGQMYNDAFSGHLYSFATFYGADYPWALDNLADFYAPLSLFAVSDGWNLTSLTNLYQQSFGLEQGK